MLVSAATAQASEARDTQQQWLDACEFALTQPAGSEVIDVEAVEDEGDVSLPKSKLASPSDPNIFGVVSCLRM